MTTVALAKQSISKQEIGMLLFLATETMFFAGLISAYLVLRAQVSLWPPLDQPRLPTLVTGINTAILLVSGWAQFLSQRSYWRYQLPWFRLWSFVSVMAGAVFLTIQGYEWWHLVAYGLATNASVYAGTFYVLVGTHALHVLAGLIYLSAVCYCSWRREYSFNGYLRIKLSLMYWTFVVAMWPVLYLLVYF